MNFSIFLIIILICFLLQLWLDNVFGDNFFFAMVYPPILIAPVFGLEGPALQTFSIYVMLGYSILFYLILRKALPTHIIKRYLPCPACSGSIPIVDSWTCDHCREMQHKERHITAMCHCHRVLRTYFCPYCDKEFFL